VMCFLWKNGIYICVCVCVCAHSLSTFCLDPLYTTFLLHCPFCGGGGEIAVVWRER